MKIGTRIVAAAVVAAMLAAGCSSSKSSPPAAGSGTTYTIGLLGDFTGLASATSKDMPLSVQARIGLAATEGYHIRYVEADTQSSPSGALVGAQKLVEQDHVFAVIAISDLTFGAASYLAAKQIPVIGAAVDGTEWNTYHNMFSVFGAPDYTKVETTAGSFFKLVGATNIGAVGYGIVPSAAEATKATAISAQYAGLKAGYVDAQFPLGSTDVGPVVLAMKNDHIDGLAVLLQQNTGFAIISALRQQGVDLKAPVLSAGYGSDLLEAGPGAEQNAQNVYFELSYEPVEMHTAATIKFQQALKTYAGYTQVPGLNEYLGYVSVDAFVAGLKAAGPNPTQASFIAAMQGITHYDAAGLFGSHSIGFDAASRGVGGAGADNCLWFTIFKGTSFHLVPGADPVCGTVIPGKSVSAS